MAFNRQPFERTIEPRRRPRTLPKGVFDPLPGQQRPCPKMHTAAYIPAPLQRQEYVAGGTAGPVGERPPVTGALNVELDLQRNETFQVDARHELNAFGRHM